MSKPQGPSPDSQPQLPHPEMGLQAICMGLLRGLNTGGQMGKEQNHVCSEDGGLGQGWGGWEERDMRLAESLLFIYLDPGLTLYIHCGFNSV